MTVIKIVTLERKTGRVLNSIVTNEQCEIDYTGVVNVFAEKYMKVAKRGVSQQKED